ncbi:hypothetical protein KIW84_057600 [Lathyrus oleraceus]|uniref:Reverse transcriptase zinc-binding domain-containing protein n=1 Tax=Pisum sativum TaxID=3888 RepID=A0A9D4X4W0_PEA|nr:hypothetical protein KIW84_057600 [Pisum sativum]
MVIHEITKMQRAFSWSRDSNHRSVNWALLSKWACKILGKVGSQGHKNPKNEIVDLGSFTSGMWLWNLACNPSLRVMHEFDNLLAILHEIVPQQHIQDKFIWWIDVNGFLVTSAFIKLNLLLNPDSAMDAKSKLGLNCVWKSNVLSKIQVFAWRLILKRLQTRDELAKQRVISGAHSLVFQFCFDMEESHYHLFLHSPIIVDVCYYISDWMGLCRICP